jgi:hypothetical protein
MNLNLIITKEDIKKEYIILYNLKLKIKNYIIILLYKDEIRKNKQT